MIQMSDTTNLDSALFINQVDEAELKWVLSRLFPYSRCGSSSNEMQFYRHWDACAIKLIYKSGKLVSAIRGPGLKSEDIQLLADKVRRELIETSGGLVARCILLSSYRVKGTFIYGDKLRIFPVPEHAPKAPDLTEEQHFAEHLTIEHPFVAEFPINRSINGIVQIERAQRQARKYALLLNVFLEGNVSRTSCGRQRHWVHEEEADLSNGYKYLRENYRYPGFYDTGPDFLPIGSHPLTFSSVEHFSSMETMEYYEYFSNTRQELNPPMRVPILLATFFDRFESLEKAEQDQFMRATFWFHHASSVWKESNSAAYLAIISSIETLVPSAKSVEKCKQCGAPRDNGPTKRFVNFINEMVPASEENIKERQKLYRLRSALTHGGDLFQADTVSMGGMNPKSASEYNSHIIAMNLARQALLGWLLKKTGGWPTQD
jgi:hypothetical protein